MGVFKNMVIEVEEIATKYFKNDIGEGYELKKLDLEDYSSVEAILSNPKVEAMLYEDCDCAIYHVFKQVEIPEEEVHEIMENIHEEVAFIVGNALYDYNMFYKVEA